MIKGIDVTLISEVDIGETDDFGEIIHTTKREIIKDVIVAPNGSSDVATIQDIDGKRIAYILAIPKGDTHNWINAKVEFFGQTFRTIGFPQEGIEDMIPLRWNRKVYVERYE